MLKSWALENKLSVVLFGHTLDDNAETVVLRIIRGSGVDGLSGIAQNRKIFGLKYKDDIEGIACFAFTNEIPATIKEMDLMSIKK